jgi:hypothetical protein
MEFRLNSVTAGPLAGGVRGMPSWGNSHSSFEFGNSDATLRLVKGGRFSMGTLTTFRDYCLNSAAWKELN